MKIQFDNRTPLYLQIIHYFKVKIASGMLKAGDEIPSRRELARRFKINPNTVQRAYKEMEELGLIYTVRNMPSKVTDDEHLLKTVREELVNEAIDNLIVALQPLNISLSELLFRIERAYQAHFEENNK